MNKLWILNASPIIIIGKAGLLYTISPITKNWLISQGVFEEISRKGSASLYLKELSTAAKVEILPVSEIDPIVSGWNLGRGESETLTLVIQKRGGVVLDDLQARKCATVLEIPLIGSVGILVRAKNMGIIKAVKPAFDSIMKAGLYIEQGFMDSLLKQLGEK